MTLYGVLDVGIAGVVLITLAMTHVTILSVTLYLHRAQAHRALDLHPALAHFFRFWLWLTTGMETKEWVAVHRRHHAKCETPDDPHSPQVLGLSRVLREGTELYMQAARDGETLTRYGRGTPDDWIERHLYSRFSVLGVILMLVIDLVLFGIHGPIVWAVQMLWIPLLAAGVINGLGHAVGYRNYEPKDASRNILPWGILIGGEELHNNHHAFPSSARLSSKWWEFDIGWMYLRFFKLLGLVHIRRLAPTPVVIPGRPRMDLDTLRIVIISRMHVFARYAKEVIGPVTHAELCRGTEDCRRLARRARKLLSSEGSRLDQQARHHLEQLLERHETLATVYLFRERLKEVWDRQALSQEALLNAMQEWCQQAEASGIQALERFSNNLKGYSVKAGVAG
ncbi:acyl-CoA desaturase [Thiocapsa imhoffii]|uniref:Acyl-CoA desaturase n=1 Tax=Thiocapsa imhoffii TaxID=382777 RepID=A0A9X0WGP6_9GAMM|nr:fatty acid desaturase [Thiocapsa imhoffii]MBK1644250.1 acyl-CoA desaturase [Thiocapsa imhoffii]